MAVPVLEVEHLKEFDAWLRSILWNAELPGLRSDPDGLTKNKIEIHRLKAILPLSNGDVKIVQGVREVFEILDVPKLDDHMTASTRPSQGKIVLIGRRLDKSRLGESFRHTINL
jgi:hypothetical protein